MGARVADLRIQHDADRQELRLRAARTSCARTQVTWLRNRLLKLGVHVVTSVRRIVLHLPRGTPHLHAWRRIAMRSAPAPVSPNPPGAWPEQHRQRQRSLA